MQTLVQNIKNYFTNTENSYLELLPTSRHIELLNNADFTRQETVKRLSDMQALSIEKTVFQKGQHIYFGSVSIYSNVPMLIIGNDNKLYEV